MSTVANDHEPAMRKPFPWMPMALLACAGLALAGGISHRHNLSLAAALLLVLVWLPATLRRRKVAPVCGWLMLAALLLVPALLGHAQLALMALPVVFLGGIAWLFGRTLRRDREPLITRCVRVIEGEPRVDLPGVRAYTRGVTVFWACLLAVMAMLSLLIALWAEPGGWFMTLGLRVPFALPGSLLEWYPEAGCWAVLGAGFAGEYLFRRWYLRRIPHPPVRHFVTQMIQRWPQLLHDEHGAA